MATEKKTLKFSPIYIIQIDDQEPALLEEQLDFLLNQLLEGTDPDMALLRVDPDKAEPNEIFDELRTLPFLTPKRIVLIRSANKFISKNRDSLGKYCDNPSPTGILILTVTKLDARLKITKKLTAAGKLIDITKPTYNQIPPRLIEYAKQKHKKDLTYQAANMLLDISGDNISNLFSEIDKLAIYTDKENSITEKHIEDLVGHNRLFGCFNVIDAIIEKNTAKAVNRLRKMLNEDKSAQFTFVGAFAYHFRKMFNAKTLLNNRTSEFQISKQLGIWGNKQAFFAQIKKLTLQQIATNLTLLAQTDFEIKTGRTRPQIAAEKLIYKLTEK